MDFTMGLIDLLNWQNSKYNFKMFLYTLLSIMDFRRSQTAHPHLFLGGTSHPFSHKDNYLLLTCAPANSFSRYNQNLLEVYHQDGQ